MAPVRNVERYTFPFVEQLPHSLRHFFAVSRLKQGVGVYALAISMGTGVEQIRTHYGRHINADAFITDLTNYQSKSGAANKASAITDLVGMVESGVIDEEAALAAFKRVREQAPASPLARFAIINHVFKCPRTLKSHISLISLFNIFFFKKLYCY